MTTTTTAAATTTTTTAATTTAAPTYADLIARLTAKQAALGDARDCRSENERAAYRSAYDAIQRCITTLANADDLAVATARLDAATAERDAWLAKREELAGEIAAFKDWRLAGNARERDAEYDRQRDLQRRLERLHRGTLYRAPGETYGTLDYLEQRVAELTSKVASIRSRLDSAVAQAGALLSAAHAR
jgi:hypothetical protein